MTYRLSFGGFDDHATAIGYVCITWGIMESVVDDLVALLCRIPHFSDESRALTSNIDFRRKLQIISTQGFLKKPDQEWFDDLHWLTMTYIDNNIRNRRNRFIHDQWNAGTEGWLKRQHAAKLIKPKAGEMVLETFSEEPVESAQIWSLVQDIQLATIALNWLKLETPWKLGTLQRRQMTPPIPGSPWTAPDHPPEPKRAKRPRPPRSSRA